MESMRGFVPTSGAAQKLSALDLPCIHWLFLGFSGLKYSCGASSSNEYWQLAPPAPPTHLCLSHCKVLQKHAHVASALFLEPVQLLSHARDDGLVGNLAGLHPRLTLLHLAFSL